MVVFIHHRCAHISILIASNSLLKDRAKARKVRELIDAKTVTADKDRGVIQKDWDALNSSTTKLEYTYIPMAKKENEVLKRKIKRQEQELDLMNRKRLLRKKGSSRIDDIIKSNENMLLGQQAELISCKKAIYEINKTRGNLVSEESRGKDRLRRTYGVLQVSTCDML